jgi:hypothetical protein
VQGLDQDDPSVGVYTTLVAQHALNELLNRLFGYFHGDTAFSTERLIQIHDPGRYLCSNSLKPRPEHWCADESRPGAGRAL